jgi:hypothetical protein
MRLNTHTAVVVVTALCLFGLIPAAGAQSLSCVISTNVTDNALDTTVAFDAAKGEYEGVKSEFGAYNVVIVTARVTNTGNNQAQRVHASLLLHEDFSLEDGEQAIKYVSPADLEPGTAGTVSWKIRLWGSCVPVDRNLEVLLSAANAPATGCMITVRVEEKGCAFEVKLPDDAVGSTGQKISIPLSFRSAISDGVGRYRLLIEFDPALLRFDDAITEGTRTGTGWRGPRTELLTSQGSPFPDVVMIDDQAIGWPDRIRFREEDTLVSLRFEVIFDPEFSAGSNQNVKQSRLDFVQDRTFAPDRRIRSALNSEVEDAYGDAGFIYFNGRVTVTSHCAVPLVPTMLLGSNHPNPFNPSTHIAYGLKEDMHVQLVVTDLFGRELRVLDEGLRSAGRHEIEFDAENLPGGVYWYQLRSAAGILSKRMLLLR